MNAQSHLIATDIALKLVAQRQAELAAQYEKTTGDKASHTRFVRLFHVRRFLSRLVLRFAAQI